MTLLEYLVVQASALAVVFVAGFVYIECHMDREVMLNLIAQSYSRTERPAIRRHRKHGPRWRFVGNPYYEDKDGKWVPRLTELTWPGFRPPRDLEPTAEYRTVHKGAAA